MTYMAIGHAEMSGTRQQVSSVLRIFTDMVRATLERKRNNCVKQLLLSSKSHCVLITASELDYYRLGRGVGSGSKKRK